jgi:hypothetical protein
MKFFKHLSLAAALYCLQITPLAKAGPWYGYGRSYPSASYNDDFSSERNYQFGVKGTFLGYEDPDFNEALSLPSPFSDSRFDSYNLIIFINDNAREEYPYMFGPAQTMRVYSRQAPNEKGLLYYWGISTGIDRATTKKGYYRPLAFSSRHWSKQFDAPMMWSIFFDGGKALHSSIATSDLQNLGKRRTSHGCVHVEDYRAEELFHLIGHSGYGAVDLFHKNGQLKFDSNGNVLQGRSYKTLIIIH